MTNLTDKWKQGKLLNGIYWVKYKNGFIDMEEYIGHHDGFCYEEKELIKEVLDEVPSYEEWQAKLEENAQLKELLKRAKEILEDEGDYMIVQEINQVLGDKINGTER